MTNSSVNSLINPPTPRPDQVFNLPNTRQESDRYQVDRFDDYIEDDYAEYEPQRNDVRDRESRDDDRPRYEDNPDKERFDDYDRGSSESEASTSDSTLNDDAPEVDRQDETSRTERTQQDDGDTQDVANESKQSAESETTAASDTPADGVITSPIAIPSTTQPTASTGQAAGAGTSVPGQTTANVNTAGGDLGVTPSAASQTAATNAPATPAAAEQNAAQAPIPQNSSSEAQASLQISNVPQNDANGAQTPPPSTPATNVNQQNGGQPNPGAASSAAAASGPLGPNSGHEDIAATATNSGIDVRKEIAGQSKPQDGNALAQASTQNQPGKNGDGNAIQIAAQSTQTIQNKLTSEPAPLLTATTPESTSLDLRSQPMGALADFNRPIEKQPMVLTIRAATSGGNPSLPVDTLALHISRNLSNGVNKFQIRLDPPELGRIDVKMEVGQDGRVQTTLAADRPETLDLLQRDAKLLQRALDDAGLKSDNGSLNFSLRDQEGNSGQSAGTGHDQGDAAQNDPQAEPEIAENAAHYIADLDTGRVDIRI